MTQYIVQRILLAVPVIIGVSVIIFMVVRVLPGDPVALKLGQESASPEAVRELREQLGLNDPLAVQYFKWVGGALRGDFGTSLLGGQDVGIQILERLPVTVELAVLALLVALAVAIPGGVLSALYQDGPVDYVIRVLSITALAIPNFWLATLMITFPAIWWHWSPPVETPAPWTDPVTNLQKFGPPAIALGAALSAITLRMTRSMVLEVLRQDYIRTARAKGLGEQTVVARHVLKNALIPTVTIVGTQLGFVLGGTVIVEQIFLLPGLGRLTLEAVLQRDIPQIQASVLFIATLVVVINLVVDLSYAMLDPRIRYGTR